jgi:hypothetical protein
MLGPLSIWQFASNAKKNAYRGTSDSIESSAGVTATTGSDRKCQRRLNFWPADDLPDEGYTLLLRLYRESARPLGW